MKSRSNRTAVVFARYLLFQLPGCVVVATILALLVRSEQLSENLAYALFLAWVLGEVALFPVLRVGYEPGETHTGVAAMIGALAIAEDDLDPEGNVRLGPERWRALAEGEGVPIPAGSAVRVRAVRELRLIVEAVIEEPEGPAVSRPRDD